MRCEQFEIRLQDLLDRRERPEFDACLLEHAEACGECQRLLAGQELLLATLAEPLPDEPDHLFVDRVMAEATAWPPRRVRLGNAVLALAGLAAMFLLMSVPAWKLPISPEGHPELAVAGDPEAAPSGALAGDSRPQPRPDADSGMSAPGPLFGDVPFHLDEYLSLLEIHGENLQHVDQLAGGFRPLASSLSFAFDAFRRSFPLGRDPRGSERGRSASVAWGTAQV
ncbi:MAG: hypothetical protein J5I93_12160 [Pirellulaceae bacterium]|nr:hypothetical protein [Pirellulaceae bacterium]